MIAEVPPTAAALNKMISGMGGDFSVAVLVDTQKKKGM
jgi:hypothetical protein